MPGWGGCVGWVGGWGGGGWWWWGGGVRVGVGVVGWWWVGGWVGGGGGWGRGGALHAQAGKGCTARLPGPATHRAAGLAASPRDAGLARARLEPG
jgi:hypothetical protein